MIQVYYTLNEKELKNNIIDSLCSKRFVGQQKETSVACAGGGGDASPPVTPPPPYGHDLVLIFSWQFEDPVKLTFKQ